MTRSLKKQYERWQKPLFWEGGFSFANFTVINGIFLIGFALSLGASNFEIGLLLAIPFLANIIQLFSAFILEFTGTKKKTALASLFLGRIVWFVMAFIAWGWFSDPLQIPFLMGALAVSSISVAIGNLSLLSWMKDLIPLRKLTQFLGKRNMYASTGGFIVFIVGSILIDKYSAPHIYGLMFIGAIVIGILALLFLIPIPEKKKKIKAITWTRLRAKWLVPLKDVQFRKVLKFGLMWGFSIEIASSFFIVFLVKDLGVSFFIISVFIVINTLGRIFGLSIFRKLGDKFGAKPLLLMTATVTSIIPLCFLFITKNNYLFAIIIFIVSPFSYAGANLAISQLMFKSAKREYDAYYFSVFSALIGLATALGPITGGLLSDWIASSNISLLFSLTPLKYIFILGFLLRASSLALITDINEPKAKDIKEILSRMKTLKYASFFTNIYSIAHYTARIVLVPQKQLFMLQRKTAIRMKRDLKITATLMKKASTVVRIKNIKNKDLYIKKLHLLNEKLAKHAIKLRLIQPVRFSTWIKNTQRDVNKMEEVVSSEPTKDIVIEANKISENIEKIEGKIEHTITKEFGTKQIKKE